MPELSVRCALGLEGFSLAVDHLFALGGITALFGASGSGKTTLLRAIAGLEGRARGRIALDGRPWLDEADGTFVPPHRRGVGFVFQEPRLFPHLTVEGNLRFAERRSRDQGGAVSLAGVVAAFDLEPLLGRRPESLSGGERQRAAMGRAVLGRPRLLLMDEPLSALDVERKAEIAPYIERLPAAFGVPVLYVTHALEEVGRFASDIVVLSQGRIAAAGKVGDILERLDLRPLTGRFEAGALIEARIVGQDARYALTLLEVAGQRMRMPALALPVGQTVRLRVRARDVALAVERPEGISIRNILEARVLAVAEEPESAFAEVLLDLGGPHLRARITREAVAELGLAPGQRVFALVKSVALDRHLLAPSPPIPLP